MREIGKVVSVNVREKTAVVALPGGMQDPEELLHQTVYANRVADRIGTHYDGCWRSHFHCATERVEELEKRILEQRGRS